MIVVTIIVVSAAGVYIATNNAALGPATQITNTSISTIQGQTIQDTIRIAVRTSTMTVCASTSISNKTSSQIFRSTSGTSIVQNGDFEDGNLSRWTSDSKGVFSVESEIVNQGHYALNDSAPNSTLGGGSLDQYLNSVPVGKSDIFSSAIYFNSPCESLAISFILINSFGAEYFIQYAFCTQTCDPTNLQNTTTMLSIVHSNVPSKAWFTFQRNVSSDLKSRGPRGLQYSDISIGPCFEGNSPGTELGAGIGYIDSISLYTTG